MRILLVEDEPSVAAFLHQGLSEQGYAVDLAADGLWACTGPSLPATTV